MAALCVALAVSTAIVGIVSARRHGWRLPGAGLAEGHIIVTDVQGGPPLPGPDGRIATPTRTVLVELHGSQLDPIRPQIRALLAAMGAEREWYDVGPDSGCVSVVMTLDGQRYEISSWYPLFRDRETVAVTDAGLVAVASRREKLEREGRNSPRYKTLTVFLDALVEHHAPSTTARQ